MSQNENPMDCTKWHIKGIELELDMQDVATVERYEAAFARMGETEKNLPKDGKASERLRAFCRMFRNLYDDIFGPGTSDKIFGDNDNARVATEVYEQFLEFVSGQRNPVDEIQNRIADRFSPNRAQRRAQARGK